MGNKGKKMVEISISLSLSISTTLKHNLIKLNYYSMITRKQMTPTTVFLVSIARYRTFFPETPKSIVSHKLSNILNPNLDRNLVHQKNIRRPDLDKTIPSN